MARDKQQGQSSPLAQLAREFAKCREERRRYTNDIKSRAIVISRSGISAKDVSEAIGVSQWSISNWKRDSKTAATKAPLKLRVVDEIQMPVVQADSGATSETARLRFGAGVELSLPVTALTLSFLKTLHDLGGERCSQ